MEFWHIGNGARVCIYGMPTGSLAKMACAYGAHARARIVMPAEFQLRIEQDTN